MFRIDHKRSKTSFFSQEFESDLNLPFNASEKEAVGGSKSAATDVFGTTISRDPSDYQISTRRCRQTAVLTATCSPTRKKEEYVDVSDRLTENSRRRITEF
jgi:hypothetical protein